MYIYNKNKITMECLDYHRHETEYRIKVKAWKNIGDIREQFFINSHSIMHVLNYVREIGMKEVVNKVISRIREENRNKKFLACGIGEVIEAPAGQEAIMGQQVCFIAANHPAVPERIVVPKELMENTGISLDLMENEYIYTDRQEKVKTLNRTVVRGGGDGIYTLVMI